MIQFLWEGDQITCMCHMIVYLRIKIVETLNCHLIECAPNYNDYSGFHLHVVWCFEWVMLVFWAGDCIN